MGPDRAPNSCRLRAATVVAAASCRTDQGRERQATATVHLGAQCADRMGATVPESGHNEAAGSREWFDDHWGCSLLRRRVLYPKEVPATQWELFEREKARHIDQLLSGKDLTAGLVLECGCGTAGMSIYLANRGFSAVATDVSHRALDLARLNGEENAMGEARTSLHLVAADVTRLPFADMSFDIVMSHGLLEHFDVRSLRTVLVEMVRVLTPGGLFLADIAHGGFSVRKVARWLSLPVALVYHLLRTDKDSLKLLWSSFCDGFYENRLNPNQWTAEFLSAGLTDTHVKVMRPFPPLDLPASMGRMYVSMMARLLRFWSWFDHAQSWATRRWGWLYLAHGTKSSTLGEVISRTSPVDCCVREP